MKAIKLFAVAFFSVIWAGLAIIVISVIAVIKLPFDLIYSLYYRIKSRVELGRKLKENRRQADLQIASFRRYGERNKGDQ